MSDSIISAIRTYMLTCPLLLEDGMVNINYLSTQMSYSLDPIPCDPLVVKYADGGAKKQFQFAFTSKELYDEDARVNLDASGFYEKLEDWIDTNSKNYILPVLPKGKTAIKMETMSKGYLYDINGEYGQYRIEFNLIYTQEA